MWRRKLGAAMVAVGLVGLGLTAACGVELPAGMTTAKIKFVCSMIGAVSPGYKWEYTRDGDARTRQFGTIPGSQRNKDITVPQRINTEILFRMSPVRPMPGEGFIKCSALCMGCGDADLPNPEAGKCDDQKECKIHLVLVNGKIGIG